MKPFLSAFLMMLTASVLLADQRLAHIFQDDMVLQREKPVPVWGWATAGDKVEVTFAGQTKQATANENGRWQVTFEPMQANADGQSLVAKIGATTVTRKNVLVGEVWVASGQSNMVAGGQDEDTGVYPFHVSPKDGTKKPEVRINRFGWGATLDPQDDIEEPGRGDKSWTVLEETPRDNSMGPTGYFGRVLRDKLNVPVGVILVAVPGTNQAAWMSRDTLAKFPGASGKNFYEEMFESNNSKLASSSGAIKSWDDFIKADTEWRKEKKGVWPGRGLTYANFPTVLYNTRIHPLAPFAIRGVIWHQGEAGPGGPYGDRLVAMVRQWRTLFGQDFDFIWGTLSRSTTVAPPLEPIRSSFYRSGTNRSIRGAISGFGDDKRVAMVELYDLGNEETHFLQKNEMGRRYALAALALSHGQPVLYSGPRMVETNIQGDRATVRFDLVGEGLVFRPSINGISGVYLRAKDGTARWGNVKIIDKSTMEVSHPDIKAIETIAYAEANNPHETLFNNEGFPASPFLVNPTNTKDPAAKFQLVAFDDKPKDVQFQIAHVRRDGYVLQLKPDNRGKPGPATLLAYIPSEWKGYEVEIGAKPVSVKETKQDGQTFVSFQADVDLKWIIVAEKGKAESFRKVNRF